MRRREKQAAADVEARSAIASRRFMTNHGERWRRLDTSVRYDRLRKCSGFCNYYHPPALRLMIIVHVFVHVKPDAVDAFSAATLENARHSVAEPGIVRFDVL